MTKISRQLGKYFILIAVLSIGSITLISNLGITLFFSNYIKETRSRDDLKTVQYVEQVYEDNGGFDPHSLMSIMHYAHSEAVTVRLRDMGDAIIWSSGSLDSMHDIMMRNEKNDDTLAFQGYPLNYRGAKIGTIEVGRPRSIFSSFQDAQFLRTINSFFAVAFLFTLGIALLLGSRISKKFLQPIYLIKENAQLIEARNYKNLNEVSTSTYELHDLSLSVKQLAERLEYQEALRKRMASDIAHELRTPISILQSHIEAFMDGVWKPDLEKLSIVHNEITRLTSLIKELSDLSIIESDDIQLERSDLDLSEVLNQVVESFEPLFISKNIHFQKEIQPGIQFRGDADGLQRVFTNILSNANKYTNEHGNVRVSLEKVEDLIVVSVEDTGIGISSQDIQHVFERFYRSDVSRSRGTGGTGIGLTITKALVEAHGGRVRIKSEAGEGTQVIIEFPGS